MGDMTKDFSRNEFACPCCGKDDIDPTLVEDLQGLRDDINAIEAQEGNPIEIRILIESGVRCTRRNALVGGKPNSEHLTGDGVDIQVSGGRMRFRVLTLAQKRGFTRVGINRTTVHLGRRKDLPQDVAWHYY